MYLVSSGVRTVTESADLDLAARLQVHMASMYAHLDQGADVICMSSGLPVLFRNSRRYRRSFTSTSRGVAVTETSDDQRWPPRCHRNTPHRYLAWWSCIRR